MTLPETWQFLGPWWWVLHILAIALVFWCGYLIGRHSNEEPHHSHHHHHHHDHPKHPAPPQLPHPDP